MLVRITQALGPGVTQALGPGARTGLPHKRLCFNNLHVCRGPARRLAPASRIGIGQASLEIALHEGGSRGGLPDWGRHWPKLDKALTGIGVSRRLTAAWPHDADHRAAPLP